MFIHVPAAWLAMFGYMLIAIAALGTLIWRHPLADVAAKTAAPIGATFTFIALVTGSLWGKPMWGTYWVWDARLTSVLVLFLLYLGLIALWQSIEEPGRAGRAAAILALVGAVNVPIIKFSVDWWNTLHQPASIIRIGGPTIDPSMLWPLLVMAVGFTLLFVLLHLIAMRAEILRRRMLALQQSASRARRSGRGLSARPMPDLGPHAIFILAAYGVTFVAVAALAFAIVEDDRKQRRILAELERKGIRRRSAEPKPAPSKSKSKRKTRMSKGSGAKHAPLPCGVSGLPCRC